MSYAIISTRKGVKLMIWEKDLDGENVFTMMKRLENLDQAIAELKLFQLFNGIEPVLTPRL